jgi:hypothetical protein
MTVDEFPIEIRHLMLHRQQEQKGKRNWSVFQNLKINGFAWNQTPEKGDFWCDVITKEKFDVFYAKYPKVGYPDDMPEEIKMLALDRRVEQGWIKDSLGNFGFKWKDTPENYDFWYKIHRGNYSGYYEKYGHLNNPCAGITLPSSCPSYKGQLEGFPPEVVELMLQRQFEQTGKRDVSLFEKNRTLGKGVGGFTWDDTIEGEGWKFWNDVIEDKKFYKFFERYPKQSLINSHIKTNQNDKEITNSNKGIKVSRPVATITTGERRTATGISGRRSKATIGIGRLSHKAIIGC